MAPTNRGRGGLREETVPVAATEEVELVTTDAGVQVTPEQAEQNERDLVAVESMKSADADEVPDLEWRTVTYVGEQPTLPTQYGTFVKDQSVRMQADMAEQFAKTTDGHGNKVFTVE
jgi:hypothetical protein